MSQGEIKFEHVDFSYEAGKPLLNGFNLTIRPGEKVGLSDAAAAGKSTIVNLLLRFYEPQSGTISIDGQNINDITQESLRAQNRLGNAGHQPATPLRARQYYLRPPPKLPKKKWCRLLARRAADLFLIYRTRKAARVMTRTSANAA